MALTIVQEVYAEVGFPQTVTLPGAPTPGNVLVAWETLRELERGDTPPNGFTAHPDGQASANSDSALLSVRVVEPGDSAVLTGFPPGAMAYVVEVSGVDSYEWGDDLHDDDPSDPIELLATLAGSGWAIAGVVWRTPTDFATEAIAPTGGTTEINDAKSGLGLVYHPLSWVAYQTAGSAGSINVTGDPNGAITHTWGGRVIILYAGGDLPDPPPVDPGFDPPDPGRAILEIFVHDEEASRWGVATWATGPATGTEGIWSGAGWQDVTPQGVSAHVIWGSSRPERGILAQQESQKWLVTTYDPDRLLDPGNVDSPYWPQIVSGVPIRISTEASGTTIRTGVIDRIRYKFRPPEYQGQIEASSTIAIAHRADVPEDSILGDTVRSRIEDAVIASGVEIGGIPIFGAQEWYPDIAISPRLEGAASLWDHIRAAGEEVLWVAYEDNAGTFQMRPWGNPLDRGREITYAVLEDLESSSSDDGVYSVVRVKNADGSAIIERVAAPLPRYGRIVFERDATTIDPETWADALLADRSWPGVTWTPGTVWCFDAADVEYMATLELVEKLRILVPGEVDVIGTILGMEMWVSQRDEERAQWLFMPKLATSGSPTLGSDILVADFTGDTLVDDDGEDDYLTEG